MAILTTLQTDILKLLHDSRRELNDIYPDQNQIMVAQHLHRLVDISLVDVQEGADGPQYGTTEGGRIELRRILAAQEKKGPPLVPPRTFNFLGEVYVPPKSDYVRNAGNKHILSKGF